MGLTELQNSLARVFQATENIAADIQRLKALVGTGMTEADVKAVQEALDYAATRLEAIAGETPEPPA